MDGKIVHENHMYSNEAWILNVSNFFWRW